VQVNTNTRQRTQKKIITDFILYFAVISYVFTILQRRCPIIIDMPVKYILERPQRCRVAVVEARNACGGRTMTIDPGMSMDWL
jgi:hypothetical protein